MASENTKKLMEERQNLRARGIKFLTQNTGENRAGFRKRAKAVARMVKAPFAQVRDELKKETGKLTGV